MNGRDQEGPAAERSTGTGDNDAPSDSWFDRLKAAIGLKVQGTVRQEIAEVLDMDRSADGFSVEERAMLTNILRLHEVRVDDVMVPRADIDAVDVGISLAEVLASFQRSGHSRMPVYRETLDDPVGLVHIKDLMGHIARTTVTDQDALRPGEENGRSANGNGTEKAEVYFDLPKADLNKPIGEAGVVRDILFVPPSMPVTALLASMQGTRMQMALVIDEYGGTDGLVSLEDVVEMVVGDIEDEHDSRATPMIVPDGDGVFLADARADLDDVSEAIGVDLAPGDEAEDVDTLGGLVFSLLGRIPVRGELVAGPAGVEFEILDADPRRLKRLRLYRRPDGSKADRRRPRPPRSDENETG